MLLVVFMCYSTKIITDEKVLVVIQYFAGGALTAKMDILPDVVRLHFPCFSSEL